MLDLFFVPFAADLARAAADSLAVGPGAPIALGPLGAGFSLGAFNSLREVGRAGPPG